MSEKEKLVNNEIMDFLAGDPVNNVAMINFARLNPVVFMRRVGDSVIVKGRSEKDWVYILCASRDDVGEIKKLLGPDDTSFCVFESWLVLVLADGRKVKLSLETKKLYFPESVLVGLPRHEVSPLPLDAVETVFMFSDVKYQEFLSCEYIAECISNGVSAGIRENGEWVAWCLTHDDGAMGFLYVREEYRQKGYAQAVTSYMILELRKKGLLPFVQIEAHNEKSLGLCRKLGFVDGGDTIWFELEG